MIAIRGTVIETVGQYCIIEKIVYGTKRYFVTKGRLTIGAGLIRGGYCSIKTAKQHIPS